MILSDRSIRQHLKAGHITIDPLNPQDIQPASIDLHLAHEFIIFDSSYQTCIDPRNPSGRQHKKVSIPRNSHFMLVPWELVLASTAERIEIPDDLVAQLDGKSSLGRLGLTIHITAGFIDPGFKGNITLELSNMTSLPMILRPGMKIGQISFHTLTTPADRPYGHPELGSKYQGQTGPVAARTD